MTQPAVDFFDALETRTQEQREPQLFAALPLLIAHAQAHAPAFAARLRDVDARAVTSRAALAALPLTHKHDLLEAQRDGGIDVFGGYASIGWGRRSGALRVFASPGPIYEPQGKAVDYWRFARALHAAGFRAGDLVHNAFSYHFTPAGAMLENGAHALGCTVFPAGTGQTEQQVQAMAHLQPAGYAGTPSFLKVIVEKAAELGVALPFLRRALVSGEAFPPALRAWLLERGIDGMQCYATADLGLIAYETSAREGLVVDEQAIVEIVRPGTGEPVPAGEVGEVVVTTLNADYPLLRFATGDLSAVMPGACPTGRTNMRIRGWLGRADQATKVRGMFVRPSQVAEIRQRFAEASKMRLVVEGEIAADRMTLHVELAEPSEALRERLVDALREATKLRGDVVLCAPGSLPNDGKVIEDARDHHLEAGHGAA
jgi:phenylacetate-CoA ligase